MLKAVLQNIDQNAKRAIEAVKQLCRIPSVAAKNEGIEETAALLLTMFEEGGFQTQLHSTSGAPVVTASLNVGAKRTLLFYDHYDVQPAEPFDLWDSLPFEPEVRNGRLYGRGVADNKGDTVSRIWAIRAFEEAGVELPVNVKFVVEGEEEISSPNLPEFVQQHTDFLKADAGIWEFGGAGIDGIQEAWLGLKGILYVQLEVQRLSHDAHSGLAVTLPSAPYRLTWALNSLKDQKEQVLIDGFYDEVQPLTEAEKRVIAQLQPKEDMLREYWGIDAFVRGLTGDALKEAFYNAPTCNIAGLTSGYQEVGSKTVLPANASAKIDFRLVENMNPEDILQKLRKHLDKHGFSDIKIAWHEGYPPAKTPIDHPFVQIVAKASEQIFEHPLRIHPTSGGSGPLYLFKDHVPMVSIGCGDHDSRAHSPNESVSIDNFVKSIKRLTVIMDELSKW